MSMGTYDASVSSEAMTPVSRNRNQSLQQSTVAASRREAGSCAASHASTLRV